MAASQNPHTVIAEWLEEQLTNGDEIVSEQVLVGPTGRETVTLLGILARCHAQGAVNADGLAVEVAVLADMQGQFRIF